LNFVPIPPPNAGEEEKGTRKKIVVIDGKKRRECDVDVSRACVTSNIYKGKGKGGEKGSSTLSCQASKGRKEKRCQQSFHTVACRRGKR